MKLQMKNKFHGTTTYVVIKHHPDDSPENFRLSDRALAAARKRLCGNSGCSCTPSFGGSAIWPPTPCDPFNEPGYWLIEVTKG